MKFLSDRVVLKILEGPTELTPMSLRPNTVFMKRDDTLVQGIGGNKARKLEFVLGDLKERGISEIVTFGAWGSNHLLTTALCAARFGFNMTAHLSPQPITEDVKKKLLVLNSLNVKMISYSNAVALGISILQNKKSIGFVEPGASSILGALGYVKAAFELVEQLKEKGLDQKKIEIYVPVGSAGTAAGLLAGFSLAGFAERVKVVGVQTVPIHWNFGSIGVFRLADKVVNICEPKVDLRKNLKKQMRQMFSWSPWDYRPGYGRANLNVHTAIERVLRSDAVALDVTYTGKAMSRLLRDLEGRPENSSEIQIFWNTFPKYSLSDLAKDADWNALPPEFHFIFK